MTSKILARDFILACGLIAVTSASAVAQGTPPLPPGAARPGQTTPTAPPPPKVVVPESSLPPNDSSVALCNNGTWVKLPGTVADCANRGGFRVAMPPKTKIPVRVVRVAPSLSVLPDIADRTPPAGATVRCKDKTYLTDTPSPTVCSDHGGVAVIFPAKAPVPAPPRRP